VRLVQFLSQGPYLDGDEVGAGVRSHCFGHECLATAGRPIEQHTGSCREAHGLKALGVLDGLRDGEGELFPDLSQEGRGRRSCRRRLQRKSDLRLEKPLPGAKGPS
jgi:hypothetical protein